MECKKNPRIDLQKKRPLFIQIGLVASLSTVLFAFELKQFEKPLQLTLSRDAQTVLEEKVPLTQRKQEQQKPPDTRQMITTIEITESGDPDIDLGDLFWPDPTGNTIIEHYKPKRTVETSEVDSFPPINVQFVARFKGGDEALYQWLSNNVRYPEAAKINNIEGVVFVRFIVELDGSITNVVVERGGLGGGCDEAAVDAVKRMPEWIPAKHRNTFVRSTFILPVEFRLIH